MFPCQQELQGYLNEYAAKHVRPENIVLNCKVTRVHTDADGKFNLIWDDAAGQNNCEVFDDVVVASGFFSKPSVPGDFSGFTGRVIHSSEYTSPEAFVGRRVAVVGSSFSSAEIAADVATTASSVRNVVPRPSWMIPRFLPVEPERENTAFLPVDLMFYQLNRKRDGEKRTEALFKQDTDKARTNAYLRSLLGGDAQDVMQQVTAQLYSGLTVHNLIVVCKVALIPYPSSFVVLSCCSCGKMRQLRIQALYPAYIAASATTIQAWCAPA
jgi:cation diffusion facilitator CzcD-associated flavoprotein CzcO